jgi:hypothetical protein
MSKTNDTSKLGRAALDHCRLTNRELDAVTGAVGEIFLTAVLPTVDGHSDATWTPAHLCGAKRSVWRRHRRARWRV